MRKLVLAGVLAAALTASAAEPLDSVVASHYPAFLASQADVHRYGDQKQQTYVELAAGAVRYVVAAYSNGEIGGVVLLERRGDGYRVDTEITHESGPLIVGGKPELKTRDIDGDGMPRSSLSSRISTIGQHQLSFE